MPAILTFAETTVEVTRLLNRDQYNFLLVDILKYNMMMSKTRERMKHLTFPIYKSFNFLWCKAVALESATFFSSWVV